MRESKEAYIGYVEMALGIGDVIGPAIGGLIHGAVGFRATFIAFASMITVGTVLSVLWIPASLNRKQEQLNDTGHRTPSVGYEDLTYSKIFKAKDATIILMSACTVVIFTLYVEPVLALQLHNEYALSNAIIGVFFLLSAASYVIGAPLSSYLSRLFNRRLIIILAFFLMSV